MSMPKQTRGVARSRRADSQTRVEDAVGVLPSDCNCNYHCKWYQADCHARAAACRLQCADCKDQCSVAYAAALAGCAIAGPGYPACAGYATTAYEICQAAC